LKASENFHSQGRIKVISGEGGALILLYFQGGGGVSPLEATVFNLLGG